MTISTILFALLPLLALISPSRAQANCNSTSLCGEAAPCCSEFGFCGTGTYCLGGCNPLFSHALDSCSPEPICADKTYTFKTLDRVMNATLYNGNVSEADWTLDNGMAQTNPDGSVALTLSETNGGTRLSSTRYVHYGTITTSLRTGKWQGVVTAFITMSDAHDEIDWEWPGTKTTEAQSNYFWLGVADYAAGHGMTHNVSSDTASNYHNYTIDWQPDTLTFSIDGTQVRTVAKTSTLDPTTGIYNYPTTPARVQLSLWPAGINTSANGTIAWAGGLINWDDPDYVSAGGHFYALVQSVQVTCATSTVAGAVPNGSTSYVYGANVSGLPSILASNASTIEGGASPRVPVAGRAGVAAAAAALLAAALGVLVL